MRIVILAIIVAIVFGLILLIGKEETSLWKVHTDKGLGFSIEFPGAWYVYPTPFKKPGYSTLLTSYDREKHNASVARPGGALPPPPGELDVNIGIEGADKPVGQTLLDWVSQQEMLDEADFTTKTQEMGQIGNGIGAVFQTLKDENDDVIRVIYTARGQEVYFISARPMTDKFKETLNRMLKSFRFLE